jgi:hypothetical protein
MAVIIGCCDTCKFFQEVDMEERGECHRYPPSFIPGADSSWPTVKPDDWCGEYREDKGAVAAALAADEAA